MRRIQTPSCPLVLPMPMPVPVLTPSMLSAAMRVSSQVTSYLGEGTGRDETRHWDGEIDSVVGQIRGVEVMISRHR